MSKCAHGALTTRTVSALAPFTAALICGFYFSISALAAPPHSVPLQPEQEQSIISDRAPPQPWSEELVTQQDETASQPAWPLEEYAAESQYETPTECAPPSEEILFDLMPKPSWLGLRHSSTHGRNAGRGVPFVGTSWRNRPYYVGGDIGALWMASNINDDVTRDNDLFGGVFLGLDYDHYWGTELALHRGTPELKNVNSLSNDRGDRLMIWTASLMYYPWGDSVFRPYWRWGLGGTEIDYPLDNGSRRDETLWTMPIGLGLKYPFRRWLAARTELTDQLAFGNNDVATQHNITLTLGLEWRFGTHPRSYWPWNPDRHIW